MRLLLLRPLGRNRLRQQCDLHLLLVLVLVLLLLLLLLLRGCRGSGGHAGLPWWRSRQLHGNLQ